MVEKSGGTGIFYFFTRLDSLNPDVQNNGDDNTFNKVFKIVLV